MTHQFPIYRNSTHIATVTPQGENQEGIMGIDVLTMSFTQNEYTEFLKGDAVVYNGQTYTLKNPSDWEQDNKWHYSLTFLAPPYKLADIQMLGLDENNELNEYECFFTGTAQAAVDFIILNANRIDPGYTRGTVDATDTQTFDFTGDNCSTALTKLSDVYKTEFWITAKTIHLTKKGSDSGLSFRRGKGMGLTKLIRKSLDTKVVTRLRVYGSKQNLPTTYPGQSKRLRMPNNQLFIQDPAKVALYGLIEDTKIFEDVFPQRVGTVTAITNAFTFSDSSIDFNLREQLIPGTSAKVKFITGQLAGWQFEIRENGYNPTTKTITINPNKDETSIEVPSETGLKPAVGDQYILIDMIMPATYITAAEALLKAKAEEAYAMTSDPRVQYEAPTDRRYLRDNDLSPKLGDYVNINEPAAGIDKDIRIISKRTNIQDKYDITIELSDTASVANIVRQVINERDTQKAINNAKIKDIARQRMNWKTTGELATLIDTLRAEMLLIVAEGGAFTTDIVIETNVGNDPNRFATTEGEIVHEQYLDHGGIWQVAASDLTLPTNGPYFIYVRASRLSNAATMVYSADKLGVESDPAYYYFPLGVLSSVIEGERIFSTLKGYTRITGNNIKTGKVEDVSGDNYFDLETGTFNLGDEESGIDYGVTQPGKLTLRGEIIATAAALIDLMVQNLRTKLTGKRVEITADGNNIILYSETNEELLRIDDDSAFEYFTIQGGQTIIFHYGPGYSVGSSPNDSAGYSSMGRKGVYSSGFLRAGNTTSYSEMTGSGLTTPQVAANNLSVKTAVVSSGTFQITDQTNIYVTGSCSLILPTVPKDGRPVVINTNGSSFQIKSSNKTIRDRGDTYAINEYWGSISWGRTFSYIEGINAWVCSGYLN